MTGPTATRGHGAPRSATAKWGEKWGGRAPETVSGGADSAPLPSAEAGLRKLTCFDSAKIAVQALDLGRMKASHLNDEARSSARSPQSSTVNMLVVGGSKTPDPGVRVHCGAWQSSNSSGEK